MSRGRRSKSPTAAEAALFGEFMRAAYAGTGAGRDATQPDPGSDLNWQTYLEAFDRTELLLLKKLRGLLRKRGAGSPPASLESNGPVADPAPAAPPSLPSSPAQGALLSDLIRAKLAGDDGERQSLRSTGDPLQQSIAPLTDEEREIWDELQARFAAKGLPDFFCDSPQGLKRPPI